MNNLLSHLSKLVIKRKKRVGRGLGSGRGVKSGRGTTRHQKARESIPLSFEGGQGRIVKRYPLLRGKGKNKPLKKRLFLVNLSELNQFSEEEVVDINSLIKKKIVPKATKKNEVKILANGKIKKKLIIHLPISKKAQQEIEKLGGKIEK